MCRNMVDLLSVCIIVTSTNVLVCTTFTLPAHMPKTDYFSSQGQVMRGKVCTMIYRFKVSKKYMVCVFSCLQRRDIACFLTCLFVSTADCYQCCQCAQLSITELIGFVLYVYFIEIESLCVYEISIFFFLHITLQQLLQSYVKYCCREGIYDVIPTNMHIRTLLY